MLRGGVLERWTAAVLDTPGAFVVGFAVLVGGGFVVMTTFVVGAGVVLGDLVCKKPYQGFASSNAAWMRLHAVQSLCCIA